MFGTLPTFFSVQLTAQRSQLKTQSDEIKERLETIRQYRDKCMDSKNQEQREIFLLVYVIYF